MYKRQALDRLEYFLRPLFNREQDKIYNINKALEFQKPVREKKEEAESIYSFEEEVLDSEEEYRRERLKMYEASLKVLLGFLKREGEISLKAIRETLGDQLKELVPDTDIFKEIMVELLKSGRLDVQMLKKERSESLGDKSAEFRLSEMFLDLLEQDDSLADVTALEAYQMCIRDRYSTEDAMKDAVPQDIKDKIEEIRKQIVDGTIKVPASQDEYNAYVK